MKDLLFSILIKRSSPLLLLILLIYSCNPAADKAAIPDITIEKFCLSEPPLIGLYDGIQIYEGGFSGMHYIAGSDNEFFLLNDRGPNIVITDHPNNLDGVNLKLFPFPDYSPKIMRVALRDGKVEVLEIMEITNPEGRGLTGLPLPGLGGESPEFAWSDLTGTDAGTDEWGIDAEAIVQDSDGNFWITDEYRTAIFKLNAQAQVQKVYSPIAIPDDVVPIDSVFAKRRPNRGFESIAYTPSGKIYAIPQSPLWNPGKKVRDESRIIRMLELDPESGTTRTFAYVMRDQKGDIRLRNWKIGDMTAINNHQFLFIDHASRRDDQYFDIYLVDISEATPIADDEFNGKTLEQLKDREGLRKAGIVPARKKHLVNLLDFGYDPSHDKPEGITIIDSTTIALINDNDYAIEINPENWELYDTKIESCIYIIRLPESLKLDWKR